MKHAFVFVFISSRVLALMMVNVEVMNSATTLEAPVCPVVRAGSVAHATPCVVQETAAAMVSILILK